MSSIPVTPGNRRCVCLHPRRDHYVSKATPKAPCTECGCPGYDPEPICRCGHGRSQHSLAQGQCRTCGCKEHQERKVA